jgi:hypothetical protein
MTSEHPSTGLPFLLTPIILAPNEEVKISSSDLLNTKL